MKILFLSQVLPYPLDAGPKIRAYFTLKHLCARHQVTLLSFKREQDPAAAIEHLKGLCYTVQTVPMKRSRWRDYSSLVKSWMSDVPFLVIRDRAVEMRQKVDLLAPANQVIHVDQLNMIEYALRRRHLQERIRIVLDLHNALFKVVARLALLERNPARRLVLCKEVRRLRAYESATVKKVDRLVWVNQGDRDSLLKADETVGEGLTERVIPIAVEPAVESHSTEVPSRFRITFAGGLHWPPNEQGVRWLLDEIWPLVLRKRPGSNLTILGARPPRSLRRAAEQDPSVEVTGYVEDPSGVFCETAVFVVPLQAGGGMRVKILDAWRHGLPVVSTSVGAEGLEIRPGKNLLLANEAGEFAEAICTLLRDSRLAQALSRNSRETVAEHYDWKRAYLAWDQVYSGL